MEKTSNRYISPLKKFLLRSFYSKNGYQISKNPYIDTLSIFISLNDSFYYSSAPAIPEKYIPYVSIHEYCRSHRLLY